MFNQKKTSGLKDVDANNKTKNKRKSVLIFNYNRVNFLKHSIPQILKNIDENTELIVIDNSSTDGSQTFLNEKNIRIITTNNLALGEALDYAITTLDTDYVIIIEAGVVPQNDCWLEDLIAPLNDEVLAVGVKYKREYLHPSCIAFRYDTFHNMNLSFKPKFPLHGKIEPDIHYATGELITRKILKAHKKIKFMEGDTFNPSRENYESFEIIEGGRFRNITILQKLICLFPFTTLDFARDGSVIFCCGNWTKFGLGNIQNSTIKEIWNGKQAKLIRKEILEGNWQSVCDETCFVINAYRHNNTISVVDDLVSKGYPVELISEIKRKKEVLDYQPTTFQLSNSPICNLDCKMCTWHLEPNRPEIVEKTEKDVFQYLDKAIRVRMTGNGDPFARPDTRRILMEYDNTNSSVSFGLLTNGLLLPRYWDRIKHQRYSDISISMDASSKETYEKIRRGGKWENIIASLDLVKENRTKFSNNITINMTVMKSNLSDIKGFIELGRSYGFDVSFQRIYGNFEDENIFELNDIESLNFLKKIIHQELGKVENKYFVKWNNLLDVLHDERLNGIKDTMVTKEHDYIPSLLVFCDDMIKSKNLTKAQTVLYDILEMDKKNLAALTKLVFIQMMLKLKTS
jgi:glycosyltransferase involved in cell wall biosynthesis